MKTKTQYQIKNWSEYNKALKRRGRIEVWIDDKVFSNWYEDISKDKRKKGAQQRYSDKAINFTHQLGKIFHQRLRQTQGLVESIFKILNINLDVPDYSTLSRRAEKSKVKIPLNTKGKVKLITDSTGLKIYGEGEWKVRKHGHSKRRTWRKLHVAFDADGEIRAVELTKNDISDGEVAPDLIDQEDETVETFSGDGGYDQRKVYDKCIDRKIKNILIPPQKNAKIWEHGNKKGPPHPRDENLREIRKSTRKKWKEDSGYHIRSLSETGMFRFKTIFGDQLNARKFANQVFEAKIKSAILNKMTNIGMPESYPVT